MIQIKDFFQVASLGRDFNQATLAKVPVIGGILDRPIDGLNIVTTNQTRNVEFYGWKSPIAEHADGSGFIFFMPIHIESPEVLSINGASLQLEVGHIYCLNDALVHWTKGKGKVVAAFQGAYKREDINQALISEIKKNFSRICH